MGDAEGQGVAAGRVQAAEDGELYGGRVWGQVAGGQEAGSALGVAAEQQVLPPLLEQELNREEMARLPGDGGRGSGDDGGKKRRSGTRPPLAQSLPPSLPPALALLSLREW